MRRLVLTSSSPLFPTPIPTPSLPNEIIRHIQPLFPFFIRSHFFKAIAGNKISNALQLVGFLAQFFVAFKVRYLRRKFQALVGLPAHFCNMQRFVGAMALKYIFSAFYFLFVAVSYKHKFATRQLYFVFMRFFNVYAKGS